MKELLFIIQIVFPLHTERSITSKLRYIATTCNSESQPMANFTENRSSILKLNKTSTITFQRMRITSSGLIGKGTQFPKAKSDVQDANTYSTTATSDIAMSSPNSNCWLVTMDNKGNFNRINITCPQMAYSHF